MPELNARRDEEDALNRALTPINELERRLSQLLQHAGPLTPRADDLGGKGADVSAQRSPQTSTRSSLGGWSRALDDMLEGLKLEATLLNSAESPLMLRKQARQEARAKRLAEAHAFAEAQLERLNRERALRELQEERAIEARAREELTQARRAELERLNEQARQLETSEPRADEDSALSA